MTRKIAFDYDRAIDSAMALFWQRGYAATGLRDLLKVMGIGEGSFYNTLKSKKQLYLACLERYEDAVTRKRLESLMSAPTAAEGVHAFFATILDDLDTLQMPSPLCMMAAMVTDEVLSEPQLRARAEAGLHQVCSALQGRLSEDRDEGLLPPGLDPQITAKVITTYLQGLWRMALLGYERPRFEQEIEAFLAGMGLAR